MKSKLLWRVALLTIACMIPAFAQDKVRLEQKRKKGDKLTRMSTSNVTFVTHVSGPGFSETVEGMMNETGEQIEEVTDVGDVVIAIRRSGKMTSRVTGGPAPGEEVREIKPTTFRFSPTGKLISADIDAFSTQKMGLEAIGDVIGYMTDQIPFIEEFPDRELSAGEEWTTTHTLKNPDGSEFQFTTKHRLFALEPAGKQAWIVSEAKVPVSVNGGPGLGTFKMTGSFEVRTHTLFSYGEGKPVKSTETLNFDLTVEGDAGGANMTIKIVGLGSGTTTVN